MMKIGDTETKTKRTNGTGWKVVQWFLLATTKWTGGDQEQHPQERGGGRRESKLLRVINKIFNPRQ